MSKSPSVSSIPITELLARWRAGSRDAESELMQAVYPMLRSLAGARLKHSHDLTLGVTELANEAYSKLVQIECVDFNDRVHFFAVAANAIRNFVVDYQRARGAEKRGSSLPFVPLESLGDDQPTGALNLDADWISVHQALDELSAGHPACARIVELKFFSGLTKDEIALATGTSTATVARNWRFARAWLAHRLAAFNQDSV